MAFYGNSQRRTSPLVLGKPIQYQITSQYWKLGIR
ncbi:uncharacterized protein G2W53_042795 [Senna tora]|uniref:Uncharacterized protein n=1 Tax=Senna tora TaxID=362788 RepID=A0A834SUI2_9FABA|nr:uncharacterized protein G2W53_042795 [Senna tora]